MRESRVFMKSRVAQLSIPINERTRDKKGRELKSGGLKKAIKFMFANKQMRWLAISMFAFMTASVAVTSYYEPFMKYSGMTDGQITNVLFAQPFIMAAVYLSCGFLADIIGRKKASLTFAIICLGSAIGFVALVNAKAAPVLIGLVFGFLISSYWSFSNVLGMMFAESAPTEMRGSVLGAQTFAMLPGQLFSLLLYTIMISFIGLGTFKIVFAIPGIVVASVALMCKVKDTKGVDMEKAGQVD
jgi:MFS family permease